MRVPPHSMLLLCLLALANACGSEVDEDDEADSGAEGSDEPATSLRLSADVSDLCSGADSLAIVARRRDCWDPELPCTLAQDPPDVPGDQRSCSEVAGTQDWTVEVTQTGKWEVELRALAGGQELADECLGWQGMDRALVGNAELEQNAVLQLERGSGPCP